METPCSTASQGEINTVVFAEDTYGVGFYREILRKLRESNAIPKHVRVKIMRLPSRLCNSGLEKKLLARLARQKPDKVVIVVDSDYQSDEARRKITRHLDKLRGSVSVVLADPRHEAWLCLGLGGSPSTCRSRPEDFLSRRVGAPFDKKMLEVLAKNVDVGRLSSIDREFARLVRILGCGGD